MRRIGLAAIFVLACAAANAASPLEALVDKGRASAFYGSDGPGNTGAMLDVLKRSQLAERMATLVNASLYLRHNLQVGFESCGQVNAFFSHQRSTVIICTEFLEMAAKLAASDGAMMKLPREQFAKVIDGLVWGVFFHELGHAVIHINRVPVTGREEDVADQFAAWYAMNFLDLNRTPVITPTIWLWMRMAKTRDIPTMSDEQRKAFLANEHSLDEQRVYNIACMALGFGSEGGKGAAKFAQLPDERAQRCPAEYAQADFAMQKLFKRYFKVKPLRGHW